jgi:cyclopropane fatty-acyl-phospholipid synthase-like methyltransferase
VIDIVLHLLRELAARPRVPATARSWEQLWAATPVEQLPWYTAALDAPLTAALAARHAPGRRLVDLGTGDGVVAIAAARCGFHVTAVDIAPSALGAARDRAERAGVQTMVFVLDDVTAPRLGERFAVAVDRGLLHSLPRDRWPSYAAGIDRLVAAGGALLVVAHQPGTELGTHAVTAADLQAMFRDFALVRSVPTTLAGAAAALFELQRRTDG